MVKNMKNEMKNENRDNVAAIGIGAMIVFIALILVAAVAAAVIIQTAEKLQQNAQTTGEDTTDMMASKITVKSVVIINTDDLYMTFELAPGSDPVTATSIQWIIACDAGANGDRDNGDFAGVGVTTAASDLTGATQTTLLPGETYTVQLNPTQCQPTANDAHNIMIQSGTGGFTYEVLNYGGSVTNGEVVV
jgi:flagellin FlaB